MNSTRLAVAAITMGSLSSCRTEVVTPVIASVVMVAPAEASIVEGEDLLFTATVMDELDQALTQAVVAWSADDPSVARVDVEGRAVGLTAGTTLIWARLDGAEGSARMTVTPAPGCGSEPLALGGKPKEKRDRNKKKGKPDGDGDGDGDDDNDDDGDDDLDDDDDDSRCASPADPGLR